MIRLLVLLLVWGSNVVAFEYPALFDVVDVAADDNLHARAEPDPSSFSIGVYAPFARDIEVVRLSKNGRWGQVNYDERSAWVSMRYLKRASPTTGPYPSLTCSGTEPFWSFDLNTSSLSPEAVFQTMEGQPLALTVSQFGASENRTDRTMFVAGPQRTGRYSHIAIVSNEICTDGMSDRTYGLTLDLTIFSDGPSRLLSGCCSVMP